MNPEEIVKRIKAAQIKRETRRHFFGEVFGTAGYGLGAAALAGLVGGEPQLSAQDMARSLGKHPFDFAPKAKSVIYLQQAGGVPELVVAAIEVGVEEAPHQHLHRGPVDQVDGFFLASGFMGHGFMMAPVVARHFAAYLRGGAPHEFLTAWSPRRFAAGAPPRGGGEEMFEVEGVGEHGEIAGGVVGPLVA